MAKKSATKKTEKNVKEEMKGCWLKNCDSHCDDKITAVYGLGFIGAAIYYITTASSFWMGIVGILKAIVWPAFLVFEAMKYFGM
jgi:hypothetical protein